MAERVRVAVRIRPFLRTDPDDADLTTIVLDPTHVVVGERRVFTVDHVFKMEDDNDCVFDTMVRPLLSSFVQGYNATIMAYGQTGTGKTYTTAGLGPRVLSAVVLDAFVGSTARLSIQCVEVYGDTLRDLLSADPIASTKTLTLRDGVRGEDGVSGGAHVVGATRVQPRSLTEALDMFAQTSRMRATGATGMNATSSRSHSVFTLFNHNSGAKLNLVDLAGSERNKRTHNVGQRLQESIGINTGLLALGNVIRALSRNHSHYQTNSGESGDAAGHVPYRASKLTRLLQDSLGGNCKTVLIACVAPDNHNSDETTRTLQYSALALRIQNEPVRNYEFLYSCQGGRSRSHRQGRDAVTITGASPPTPDTDEDGDEATALVPADQYTALERLYSERGAVVAALQGDVERLSARVRTCEDELRKDEIIFTRQIAEMHRLVSENASLHARVSVLEGRTPSTPPAARGAQSSSNLPAPQQREGDNAFVRSILQLHEVPEQHHTTLAAVASCVGTADVMRDQRSSNDLNEAAEWQSLAPLPPPPRSRPTDQTAIPSPSLFDALRDVVGVQNLSVAAVGKSHRDAEHPPSALTTTHTTPLQPPPPPSSAVPLSASVPTPAPLMTTLGPTAPAAEGTPDTSGPEEQLMALTREALHYQTHNTELRNKLGSVVALLESQRRETALLRLELNDIHHLLDT